MEVISSAKQPAAAKRWLRISSISWFRVKFIKFLLLSPENWSLWSQSLLLLNHSWTFGADVENIDVMFLKTRLFLCVCGLRV